MRQIAAFAWVAALAGCGPHASTNPAGHAHPGGDSHAGHQHHAPAAAALTVHADPSPPAAGRPAELHLTARGPGGDPVKDFAVVHEAKVHLIVVRDGLDTFAHLHPDIDAGGRMTVAYAFPTGGTYRLFADYQPAGGRPATAAAEVKVTGDAPPAPPLTPNVPGRVTGDGLAAEVSVDPAVTGRPATVRFTLSDAAGAPVTDLQPYLGAMGHLTVISADGRDYVHAHPADGPPTGGNVVSFQAHFPRAGTYKGWGQFRRADRVHTVPFVVKVG